MIKSIIILIMVLLVPFSVSAALEPSIAFCLHNDYEVNYSDCIFDDGNMCETNSFLNRSCGEEYIKEESEIPCRVEGESLYWNTEECCEGLTEVEIIGPTQCGKPNFFQKIWIWFLDTF